MRIREANQHRLVLSRDPKHRFAERGLDPGRPLSVLLLALAVAVGSGITTAYGELAEAYALTDIHDRVSAALVAQIGISSLASKALDVSNRGEVVGYVEFLDPPRGVLRWPFSYDQETGQAVLFGAFFDGSLVLSGEFTAVNEAGLCVGRAAKLATRRDEAVVASASSGALLPLAVSAPSRAADINETDWVVGDQSGGIISQQSFLITDSGASTPVNVSPLNSHATALNDAGQLVGYAETTAGLVGFVAERQGAGFATLTLNGFAGNITIPQAINDGGFIVGESATGAGRHAFLTHPSWNGQLQDLGTLGGSESHAFDINTFNIVVGASTVAGEPITSAFAMDLGQPRPKMVDLGDRLPEAVGSVWQLVEAVAVNDHGWIVGAGVRAPDSRFSRAFLLSPDSSPKPDPDPDPGNTVITLTGTQIQGASLTATWSTDPPDAPVDIYRSTDLRIWTGPVSSANRTGAYHEPIASEDRVFYRLAPARP